MKKAIILIIIVLVYPGCKGESKFDDDAKLCEILTQMTADDQRIRDMDLFRNGTQKVKDSLWAIQRDIDMVNTEKLIKITKERGWLSKKGLGCQTSIAPLAIFRHAPKKYFNEIKTLIDKEFEEGRLDGLNHAFIDDHLNGRPGLPFEIVEEN